MKTGRENIMAYWAMIMALAFAANGVRAGWEYAHATFYGDMSGADTMSKCVCVCVCLMFSSP